MQAQSNTRDVLCMVIMNCVNENHVTFALECLTDMSTFATALSENLKSLIFISKSTLVQKKLKI